MLPPLAKILYLAVNIVLVRPPVLIMLFAENPVYATYELAPPIRGIFALEDQQFAGGIMKIGSSWILMAGISAVLYKWWKEEREGVFVDYNQNAKDRTVASAYSVRATSDGR